MFCTKCGKKILDDNKFCPYCGEKLQEIGKNNVEQKQAVSLPKEKPKWKSIVKFILGIFLWSGFLNFFMDTFTVVYLWTIPEDYDIYTLTVGLICFILIYVYDFSGGNKSKLVEIIADATSFMIILSMVMATKMVIPLWFGFIYFIILAILNHLLIKGAKDRAMKKVK